MRRNKQKGGGLKMLYKRTIRKLTGNQAIHQLILNLHMMSCTGVRCADCPMASLKQDGVCFIKQKHRTSIVYGLLEELGVSKEQVNEILEGSEIVCFTWEYSLNEGYFVKYECDGLLYEFCFPENYDYTLTEIRILKI